MTPNEIRFLAAALDAGLAVDSPDSRDSADAVIVSDVLRLARETGTPRSRLLRLIADALDDGNALVRDAELAAVSARNSAAILAGLPLLTAVLAGLFGVNVLGFLLGNPFGVGCLAVGVAATFTGWRWMSRLRSAIVAPSPTTGLFTDCVAEVLSVVALSPDARELFTVFRDRWEASGEWTEVERLTAISRDTGVPVVGLLREASRELRRRTRFDVRTAIETLPGKLLTPLGVCLFPAFVALTVIPSVATMATGFLGGVN